MEKWFTGDGKMFVCRPEMVSVSELPPGYYQAFSLRGEIFFSKIDDMSDKILRFESETVIDDAVNEINSFWEKRDFFAAHKFPFRRGIILHGPPGCHAPGTKILMYNGSFKNVEDIQVDDYLMGPDSKPRRVLDLCAGYDDMYKITPVKGDSFIVNGHHILHLQRSGNYNSLPNKLNISVNEYLEMSKPSREKFKLIKSKSLNFKNNANLLLDPYFLGLWLGDGTSRDPCVTTIDEEIEIYLKEYAKSLNLELSIYKNSNNSKVKTFRFISNKNDNYILNSLKKENLLNNKHIPQKYLLSSEQNRLELLAGIIDTDGHYSAMSWRPSEKRFKKGYKGSFDIVQKSKNITDNIIFLAKSLGFGVSCKLCNKKIKSTGFNGDYYRLNIFGDIHRIPVKLPRKIACFGSPNKNHLITGIKSIDKINVDKYYGFTLDKDHLYITGDFNIHHNSGKSCAIKMICQDITKLGGIAITISDFNHFEACMAKFRELQPTTPVVVIMEDLDDLIIDWETEILNMMDGFGGFDGVVFLATTNYLKELPPRIRDRPSRFDRRFHIKFPKLETRKEYFKHITSTAGIGVDKIDVFAEKSEGLSFAHMKEMFVSVMGFDRNIDEVANRLKEMANLPDEDDGFNDED